MKTSSSPPAPSRLWFFGTAFTTGAVVMALEILGSRLLAPVFGSSLFVWGALIGVVLAAMSSGYAAGGWLADRRSPHVVLTVLLLGSGAWTLLLAWVGQSVVFTVSQWTQDPRWGPCLAASVLLGVPAFGLSGVLPALLRMAIADMGHLGRHTGGMIAISTIGSLIGTWGTSFYLLTWLGSGTLVALLGLVLSGLGFLWAWWMIGLRIGYLVALFAGLVFLGWTSFHPVLALPPAIHQEDSPYQQLRVRDIDELRFLILNNTFHAVMWKVAPTYLVLPYSQVMMAALSLPEQTQRGLILGHGGGSLAKWLAEFWPKLELDVVEMDPSVVNAAEAYFDYKPPSTHHVYVQDARTFLSTTSAQYDLIWIDVFARHLIPFHLTTQEFYRDLQSHLTPWGVIAVNLASSDAPPDIRRAQAIVTTLNSIFPDIEAFNVPGPSWLRTAAGSVNTIFFAGSGVIKMRDKDTFRELLNGLVQQNRLPSETLTFFHRQRPVSFEPGITLTDDFSPMDVLQGQG
jgi:spermidine synthase